MFIIQGTVVSEDILEYAFLCNLEACKGACCWEGDYGAPLNAEELQTLERIYGDVRPFLTETGRQVLEKEGLYVYYREPKEFGTPLVDNGPCAYLTYEDNGIAKCGIETAYRAGATDFQKPISCHLYPIRISEDDQTGIETLVYDRWEICSPACTLGAQLQMPLYRFVREALLRKYGQDFYDELEAAANYWANG